MKLIGIIALCLVGVILMLLGIIVPQIFPSLMARQLESKLILSEDSSTLGNFISPPVPIFMQFYFFNITNPVEILQGKKASLKQIGPFTYEEKRLKYDLLWENEAHSVTFKQNKTFFFRPDLSNGLTEDIELTVPNMILLVLASKASTSDKDAVHGFFEIIRLRFDMNPFIKRKARELLFEGYREDMLLFLHNFTNNEAHKRGRFGFFYPKNNSNEGSYRVFTGASGLELLQTISEFRGQAKLDYWHSDYCNMINGTEGSVFPRPITPNRKLYMYSADLCRSLYFKFEKVVHRGNLPLYRYVLPRDVLAITAETRCFCSDDFTCKDSMVNLSPCKDGSPVVTSTPHFYMGSDETIYAVDGLSPNKEEHETFLEIEPNTGVTFHAHKRIQISVPLRRYSALNALSHVREVVLPIVWLNESAAVPIERANALYSKLTVPELVVKYVCLALVAIGAVLLLVALYFTIRRWRGGEEQAQTQEKLAKNGKKFAPVNEYDRTDAYKHLFPKN